MHFFFPFPLLLEHCYWFKQYKSVLLKTLGFLVCFFFLPKHKFRELNVDTFFLFSGLSKTNNTEKVDVDKGMKNKQKPNL